MEDQDENFKPETVHAIYKSAWKEPTTRANRDALLLSCEFIRLFIIEAVHRSSEEQDQEGSDSNRIRVEHLERTLTQLLLDF